MAGFLFNNLGSPEGGDSNQWDAVPINNQVAYVAGSTSTGPTHKAAAAVC